MRWLRTVANWPKLRTALVLALPAVLVVIVDLSLRGRRVLGFPAKYVGSYLFAVIEGGLAWAVLLACASARRGALRWVLAALFVVLTTTALGAQIYFYRQYSTYLNLDVTLWATSVKGSVWEQLDADRRNFLWVMVPTLLGAMSLVWLGRRWVRTRKRALRLGALASLVAVPALLVLPCSYRAAQGSTPDVLYFHAIGGLLANTTGLKPAPAVRPGRRAPPTLPKLTPRPPVPRNVLFILTESVRADLACSEPRDSCPAMPLCNRALPSRMPLSQMRANATTTAIELAVLWSGLAPNAGREALHSAPVLFDFAHAAGLGTAYWTSHHMMFANSRLWVQDLPLDQHCHATTLDPVADIDTGADDRLLTERVRAELPELREPFFALAQFGNTHVPYRVDPLDAPFQPSRASKAEDDNLAYKNYYTNAVYAQDRAIAELVEFVRAQPFGDRTVIFYTSDHGEQFREHGQLGHTGSLFDVELHVPTFFDAPDGSLTVEERRALRSYASVPTFHTDVTPTLLDLMGLLDEPALASYRAKMVGGSLLRPNRPLTTLALTNCAGVWGCAFENWGVMRGFRKLHAREWDSDWLCYDVITDPNELKPISLGDPECAKLSEEANQIFGSLPGRGAR